MRDSPKQKIKIKNKNGDNTPLFNFQTVIVKIQKSNIKFPIFIEDSRQSRSKSKVQNQKIIFGIWVLVIDLTFGFCALDLRILSYPIH